MQANKMGIIYCRVSTTKQKNYGDSLNKQERLCRSFCSEKGIKVLGVYKEAYTGKSSQRPVFDEAMYNAVENKVTHFIIFDIDRFSREGYGAYSKLKDNLIKNGIQLKDSKNIIGDNNIVCTNNIVDMSQYKWNIESSSQYAEVMLSTNAEIEGKKIIQRTISKEIELEQIGYHVRPANFGYKLKVAISPIGKSKIQIADEIEGKWIEKIFEYKANGILSDQEIVDKINMMGYKSRKKECKLNIKQMQVYLKKPVYAGVISSKYTGNTPIYTAYDGLVSINTWNKANKGKYKILEKSNGELQILNGEKEVDELIIKRRKKFDNELPFRNLVKSSMIEDKYISGSISVNSKKQKFPYYHPIRQKGKVGENIKKEEFENNIYSLLEEIKVDEITEMLFNDVFDIIFEKNKEDLIKDKIILENRLKGIKSEIIREEAKVDNVIHLPRLLNNINKNLEELDKEEINIKEEIEKFDNKKIDDIEKFKGFCFYILAHFDDLVKESQNLEELQVIFKFIFKEVPHYDQIVNRTAPLQPILALQSQQKNPSEDEFPLNMKWQPNEFFNQTQIMEAFVKRMMIIYDRYKPLIHKIDFAEL